MNSLWESAPADAKDDEDTDDGRYVRKKYPENLANAALLREAAPTPCRDTTQH